MEIYYRGKEVFNMSKETKRERFVRLAEARTNKIINMLQLLGNCSSRINYEYTDEEVEKIFKAINKSVEENKNKFKKNKDNKKRRFVL